jgi:hypothetical protein
MGIVDFPLKRTIWKVFLQPAKKYTREGAAQEGLIITARAG